MTAPAEQDLLRRIERRAVWMTAVVAIIAAAVPHGGWSAALGVLGGALLMSASYWAIKRGVVGLGDVVIARDPASADAAETGPPGTPPRRGRMFVLMIGRYALLAGMAYVMIARLRLHPIGLMCGATMIPAAAAVEILRGRPR